MDTPGMTDTTALRFAEAADSLADVETETLRQAEQAAALRLRAACVAAVAVPDPHEEAARAALNAIRGELKGRDHAGPIPPVDDRTPDNDTGDEPEPAAVERPDPDKCPTCGTTGSFEEYAKRYTWQPITLDYDPDDPGQLYPADYGSFDYGDDTEVTGCGCRSCGTEWPTLGALAHAQRIAHAIEGHAETADSDEARAAYAHALEIIRGNGEA